MFAHNHTEAGEAKGGAAAAAAEVNKCLLTSAHLRHIPDISAGFLTHISSDEQLFYKRTSKEAPELFALLTLCGHRYRLEFLSKVKSTVVSAAISSFLLASCIFHDRVIH